MGRAARIARRHGLGGVVRTYRQALPFWFHPLFLGIIVVILGALALNQDLGIGAKIAGASVPVLFTLIAWWMLADVRMVLCEGGIVIGRFFPLLAPYVVPYGAIEPRGVTCVSDVGRLRVATGRSYGSTLFHFAHSRRGVVFDGPPAARARTRNVLLASSFDTAADTVRGGTLWAFAYRGSPDQLIAHLQNGLRAQGVPFADALPATALPERQIGTDPSEARTSINGLAR